MYYFFHAIGLLLAACVFTTTLAGPYPNIHNDISQPEPLGSRDDEKRYYIKTRVHAGDDKSKDGLYVDIYHIGPGQNAVVLHKEPRFQAASNGTGIRFPSYLRFDMNEDFTYDGWVPVLINPFSLEVKVTIQNATLVWLSPLFQGWLVCDWALQEPQLFRFNERYNLYGGGYPSTCAQVDLVLEDT